MRKTGVRELRLHLSRYLKEVKDGEPILITERGAEIAQILPLRSREDQKEVKIQSTIRRLSQKGLVQLPLRQKLGGPPKRIKVPGTSFSDAVIEDRR